MDPDLLSIQQARTLLAQARTAFESFHDADQERVDRIVRDMVRAGSEAAERLAKLAVEETGFGRVESKIQKNLFATRVLHERMASMKTCGVINTLHGGTVWEIASPMGVVAGLVPSTNPTSTAMYKAIIAAKARCAIVISPHPRAIRCTAEALNVVATAAVRAGAPEGLFGCMTHVSIPGTEALLEDAQTDLILATGGSAMVKAAYSKGKPAYGVGSGNVPVYVDRSADIGKAASDITYGASFDWGTLCSTERSVVADAPISTKLKEALQNEGAIFLDHDQKRKLRALVVRGGRLNVDQVGRSPEDIAQMAGFAVPKGTRALVAEVEEVGPSEPLSMETLSPILSWYVADGWRAGCARCKEILHFGGIGHTLGLHATSDKVIEAFALEKPAMRIVVNTVCALGSVGYTNELFPAMTLGPGTLGGSITSDNISPLHLINVKRLAFETRPINKGNHRVKPTKPPRSEMKSNGKASREPDGRPVKPWMEEIEARLNARAGNPPSGRKPLPEKATRKPKDGSATSSGAVGETGALSRSGVPGKPGDHARTASPPDSAQVRTSAQKETASPPSPAPKTSISLQEIDRIAARFRK